LNARRGSDTSNNSSKLRKAHVKKILSTNKYFKKSLMPPEYGNNQSLKQVLGFSKDIANLQKLGVPKSLLIKQVKNTSGH
jgi:hypothetical protein